jgi:hypothetical protein
LGIALVAGKKRVPNPATGKTAFRTRSAMIVDLAHRWIVAQYRRLDGLLPMTIRGPR